jgi:hypothetical protein
VLRWTIGGILQRRWNNNCDCGLSARSVANPCRELPQSLRNFTARETKEIIVVKLLAGIRRQRPPAAAAELGKNDSDSIFFNSVRGDFLRTLNTWRANWPRAGLPLSRLW